MEAIQINKNHILKLFIPLLFLIFGQSAFAATATASSTDGSNVASNVLDGNINTRWSGNGIGTYLTVDLGKAYSVSAVKLAFHKGDQRTASFNILVSEDGSNYSTVRSNASSSGSTVWNQTFSFTATDARYIRYVNLGNSQNNWGSLTKFSTTKTTATGGGNPGGGGGGTTDCDVPADVLDLSNWKITIPYSNTSGTSDGNTNNATEIDQPALDNYELNPEFTNSGCDYVQFRAHAGGATTNGSGYPRSELREMVADGSDEIEWSSGSGTHEMEVRLRVTHLPVEKPHITIAQIHDGDDDVITFRLEGEKLFMEIDGSDGSTADSSYSLGEIVTLKFVVSNNQTRAYYNGSLVETLNQSYSGAYFKTGAYVQSACGGSNDVDGESCSAYGEVEIFDVSVSHN